MKRILSSIYILGLILALFPVASQAKVVHKRVVKKPAHKIVHTVKKPAPQLLSAAAQELALEAQNLALYGDARGPAFAHSQPVIQSADTVAPLIIETPATSTGISADQAKQIADQEIQTNVKPEALQQPLAGGAPVQSAPVPVAPVVQNPSFVSDPVKTREVLPSILPSGDFAHYIINFQGQATGTGRYTVLCKNDKIDYSSMGANGDISASGLVGYIFMDAQTTMPNNETYTCTMTLSPGGTQRTFSFFNPLDPNSPVLNEHAGE